MQIERTKIGYLVGGGLKENFRVRLTVSPQEIQEGAFVVIQSGDWNYYGIVTDIQLGATDQRVPAGFAPIAIGLALTLIHLVGIPVTNLSVNPARSTGPAVLVGGWALVQLWLFASGVIYAADAIPEKYLNIASLNPAVGAITGFRWAVVGTPAPSTTMMALGLASTVVLFIGGLWFYRRAEPRFADTI